MWPGPIVTAQVVDPSKEGGGAAGGAIATGVVVEARALTPEARGEAVAPGQPYQLGAAAEHSPAAVQAGYGGAVWDNAAFGPVAPGEWSRPQVQVQTSFLKKCLLPAVAAVLLAAADVRDFGCGWCCQLGC